MALNFSEFLDSFLDPKYRTEGKKPTCPKGYKWDEKLAACVPTGKKGENPGQKQLPPGAAYNVWGSTGLNGEPPAIGVDDGGDSVDSGSLGEAILYHKTRKDEKRHEDEARRHKEQDDRMRYGKKGKAHADDLRPGEVKRWDKVNKD